MSKQNRSYSLDFEKPLLDLEKQIYELRKSAKNSEFNELIQSLEQQLSKIKEKIYSSLTPEQTLQIARHQERPHILDYIKYLGTDWIELHGDRSWADDKAIIGGLIEITEGMTVILIGVEKGKDMKDKQKRNFGMPQPWGYRKALRLLEHAETFCLPVITLIDTPGAYPGLEAESQGQARAIAQNIQKMSGLKTPVISIITGEGGSGGALALGVADKVFIMEHAIYSVISPEGCAAILWRTKDKASEAASKLRITSHELLKLGLVDQIIKEPDGGAHSNHEESAKIIKNLILETLSELKSMNVEELVMKRRAKLKNYGTSLLTSCANKFSI